MQCVVVDETVISWGKSTRVQSIGVIIALSCDLNCWVKFKDTSLLSSPQSVVLLYQIILLLGGCLCFGNWWVGPTMAIESLDVKRLSKCRGMCRIHSLYGSLATDVKA